MSSLSLLLRRKEPRPNEPKLFIFSWMVSIVRAVIPRPLRRTAGALLFGVTPAIPLSLNSILPRGWPRRAFLFGVALSWFFCFIVIFFWTHVAGTYEGTDALRIYFRHDWENLINYTLLVPLYVGFGATLIVLACQSWVSLQSAHTGMREPSARSPRAVATLIKFVTKKDGSAMCLGPFLKLDKIIPKTCFHGQSTTDRRTIVKRVFSLAEPQQ
jgi:hypothetical protein